MAKISAKHVADLIDRLEFKMDSGLATPDYLRAVQQELHALPDEPAKGDASAYHQYAAELQALAYSAEGKEADLRTELGKALAYAGTPKRLRSRLLKNYLRSNPVKPDVQPDAQQVKQSADLSMLSAREQQFMWSHGLQDAPNVPFFVRPPKTFFGLLVLTGGLYATYWFYKNWQAVRIATGRSLSPFWRTVFTIFYVWPLFKTMALLAKCREPGRKYPAYWLAAGYLFMSFLASPVLLFSSSWLMIIVVQIVTSCFTLAFLVWAQQAAIAARGKQDVPSRLSGWVEWLFVVLGVLSLVASNGWRVYSGLTAKVHISPWQQMQASLAQQQVDVLTVQYQSCSAYIQEHKSEVDPSDKERVAAYHAYVDQCQAIHGREQVAQKHRKLIQAR